MERFKVDEMLPRPTAQMLREAGHDAVSVGDQGMVGWRDDPLAHACRSENRTVLTIDRRFSDPRRHRTRGTAGIVVLRPPSQGRAVILDYVCQRLLPLLAAESPIGALWIVEPHRLRVHRDHE